MSPLFKTCNGSSPLSLRLKTKVLTMASKALRRSYVTWPSVSSSTSSLYSNYNGLLAWGQTFQECSDFSIFALAVSYAWYAFPPVSAWATLTFLHILLTFHLVDKAYPDHPLACCNLFTLPLPSRLLFLLLHFLFTLALITFWDTNYFTYLLCFFFIAYSIRM